MLVVALGQHADTPTAVAGASLDTPRNDPFNANPARVRALLDRVGHFERVGLCSPGFRSASRLSSLLTTEIG
jgi:hypothetical protein